MSTAASAPASAPAPAPALASASVVGPLTEVGTLRLATAGSVDDGKSTLVGRLLHDSKSVLADQLESISRTGTPDLALLTDGLRAEREQGITIDVAYRYFATPRRRFVLADTPGHVQYTRNMVTGASTAELTIILVDARAGVVAQTRRHAAIAALLRVPHVVLAVNKMDLVAYEEAPFAAIEAEFAALARELDIPRVTTVPISALAGDNVVEPSAHMPWYAGPTILAHLETVPVTANAPTAPARFPVQYVIRHAGSRHYAGRLVSGTLRVGDAVAVHPSGRTSTIAALDVLGTPVEEARAGTSLSLRLTDDLDVARGDLLSPTNGPAPTVTRDIHAATCHLADQPLRVGQRVLLRHTTRTVRAVVRSLADADALRANDLGRVVLRTADPVAVDPYAENRWTGSFLLIDPSDGTTLTAGMAQLPR
ncbi:sulfate adenylyltransferase subunit 1 [Streptomyces sp. NPDC016845]|uniref:sulfate adenylyltransferase subunit 1 n=1 Tax=Streptomyces sp. NPDC016845 TaxID=3364972 RepID=UPI00379E57DD